MRLALIVGKSGSGKTTFLKIAKENGIKAYDMSYFIFKEAERVGISKDPLSILSFSKKLREERGKGVVAEMAMKELKKLKEREKTELVVISGIRSPEEIEVFKKHAKCISIFIKANQEERWKRKKKRKKESNPITKEEFIEKDKKESEFGLDKAIELCELTLENNKDLKSFKRNAKNILEFLKCR